VDKKNFEMKEGTNKLHGVQKTNRNREKYTKTRPKQSRQTSTHKKNFVPHDSSDIGYKIPSEMRVACLNVQSGKSGQPSMQYRYLEVDAESDTTFKTTTFENKRTCQTTGSGHRRYSSEHKTSNNMIDESEILYEGPSVSKFRCLKSNSKHRRHPEITDLAGDPKFDTISKLPKFNTKSKLPHKIPILSENLQPTKRSDCTHRMPSGIKSSYLKPKSNHYELSSKQMINPDVFRGSDSSNKMKISGRKILQLSTMSEHHRRPFQSSRLIETKNKSHAVDKKRSGGKVPLEINKSKKSRKTSCSRNFETEVETDASL